MYKYLTVISKHKATVAFRVLTTTDVGIDDMDSSYWCHLKFITNSSEIDFENALKRIKKITYRTVLPVVLSR